ncbi:MAG TPA: hypothetical protein VGJ43_03580, partial [Acidimicrobiales bacterium]
MTAAPTRPHPRSRVEPRPLRSMSAGQWLRGAGAALALLVLLVAVPLALLRWGEWPITGLPTGQQIRDLPSSVASDAALIGVFTVALWLVWALFAVCVGAEVVAEVRGRDAGRVRVAGPLQGVAGRLVATVAMTAGSLGPLAGAAAGAPPVRPRAEVTSPTAAHTAAPPGEDGTGPVVAASGAVAAPAPGAAPAAAGPSVAAVAATPVAPAPVPEPAPALLPVTVTVGPGDSAWRLAEHHLGDGARWGEIWALNQGRPQPDGQSWSRPELLRPGWELTLPAVELTHPAAAEAGPTAAADAVPAGEQIVVEPDDNPWSVAETHLGDGKRWRELFALNRGRTQPDGGAWVTEGLIRPGWILALPAGTPGPTDPAASAPAPAPAPALAATAAPAPAAEATTAGPMPAPTTPPATDAPPTTQARHDPDSGLAPTGNGSTPATPRADATPPTPAGAAATPATAGSPTGNGSTPANPADAPAAATPVTDTAPDTHARHDPDTGLAPTGNGSAPVAPPAGALATPPATSSPTGNGAAPTPTTAATGPAPATTAGSVDGVELVGADDEAGGPLDDDRDLAIKPIVWVGIPAVLAGGVALRLDALRRRRMRKRPRLAAPATVPAELQPTERTWRAIADRESAEWVDTTLRYLTWAVRSTASPIDVVGVRTGPAGLALLLDGPAPAGAPRFAADATGWAWTLQCDDLDEIRGVAADEAPYAPGLVTLGTSDDGSTVLVDLERLGLLSVEGDATVVRDWLTGLSLDLATAPWAGDVDLRLVGGLTALAALDQVGVLAPDAVPAAVAGAVDATNRALGDHATTQAARSGDGGEPWPPLTIIAADAGLDPATTRAAAPGRGAAVVAVGPVPGATHRLVAGADGFATLYPFGLSVRLSGGDPRTAGDTARLLTAAAAPAPPPVPAPGAAGAPFAPLFAPVASPPADVPDEVRVKYASLIRGVLAPAEIEVVVLGRPIVTGWQVDPRQRSVEIVCYLAVHDGPVSGDKLRDCIFPPGFKATSLRQAVSRTRTALGRSASGDPHILPAVRDGSYELGPGVRSDAGRLQALLTAARTAPEVCEVVLLRSALALVRAQPFSDAPAGGYGWASAEGISYALERQITDAAHRL